MVVRSVAAGELLIASALLISEFVAMIRPGDHGSKLTAIYSNFTGRI